MDITFRRIDSLNTLTHSKTSIVIEDLTDDNNNASGTRVTIDFYKSDQYDKNSNN